MAKLIKVTLHPDPIRVETDAQLEEWRRDGMLLEILGEADAEAEEKKEGEGDGQEAGVQDQASGSIHQEGKGGGGTRSGVRPQGDGK